MYPGDMSVSRPPVRLCGLAALTVAVAAVAALAAPAAAKTTAKLTGRVTPVISGFPTTPQSVNLNLHLSFASDPPGQLDWTLTRATVWFTHGARVNARLFPACDARRLAVRRGDPRACPRGSRIGRGTVVGAAIGVRERLAVEVYNGKGGHVLMWIHGVNPIDIAGLLNGPLTALRGGLYGFRFTTAVPFGLQQLGAGIWASVTDFNVTIGATTRVRVGRRLVKRGYIETYVCPPGALLQARGDFTFRDGTAATTSGPLLRCG